MIDYLVLQSCQSGSCPQQVAAVSYVLAPQVVAAAPLVPCKTKVVTKYKSNLFGKLVPGYATVTTNVAASVEASSGSSCKSCKN